MEQLKEMLADLINDHWLKALGALACLVAGRWWGSRKARKEWAEKEFPERLMVSLNTRYEGEEGQTLAIRTLLEKNLLDVLLNPVAVQKVTAAAKLTTEKDPLLPLDKDDRWYILNAVLNEVAEQFSAGTLARDMGLPVQAANYLLCLTNEVAGDLRTRKLRVMVARKDLLESGAFEELALESPHHQTRLQTLRCMRAALEKTPDLFLDVELCLPTS